MVKLIQYDYIMRSEVFSTNAFIQICNFSMNAALFRRFACRPAAFLSVWGGQPEREASLFNLKFLAARVLVYVRQLADGRVFAASTAFCSLDSIFSAVPAALVPMGTRWVISPFSST